MLFRSAPSFDTGRTQSQDGRPDSSSARARAVSRDQKTLKRVVAVGVVRVDALMRARSETDQYVTLWSHSDPFDESSGDDGPWDEILTEIYPSASRRYTKHPIINRLTVHLKPFAHPDAERLVEMTPTLLHNIKQTRKIGFSGAPTKSRSDIYLTLVEPYLPRHASLSHPKTGTVPLVSSSPMCNLQLTIEVRKSSGERIEDRKSTRLNSSHWE